jgi:hypothetical protein
LALIAIKEPRVGLISIKPMLDGFSLHFVQYNMPLLQRDMDRLNQHPTNAS